MKYLSSSNTRSVHSTRDKGTIMRSMTDKVLEVFVDASFCGDWYPKEAVTDRDTARSRHGYIINYAGCNPSDGTSEGNEEER
jgi:hypothetical protein